MTDKRIKNEQWTIKQLISKIHRKEISKPKFQRKKKWDILPKNENTPNEHSFIQFLYETENSVHAVTFGQESTHKGIIYSNIDGNNRINAITHFMDKPFDIFHEYLDNLFKILDTIESKRITEIKEIFESLSYKEIINIGRLTRYFNTINKCDLFDEIQKEYSNIEDEIEKIQGNLKINGTDRFDECVRVNVNLFEGYNTDELCKTFEDINKYNSKLTETELLACRLHNKNDFIINDKPFETKLKGFIKQYYINKAEQEALNCFEFQDNESINAHDFIIGYQNLSSEKYNFIAKTNVDGLSLFFKLWKAFYKKIEDTFTTKNINDFIDKINYACEILQETISNIFTDKINNKLFNNSCQDKLNTLKKNNLFIIISSIIGYKYKNINKDKIVTSLEKCLLFHFFVSDIKCKVIRDEYYNNDAIHGMTGKSTIDKTAKNLLSKPEDISAKLDKDLFEKLMSDLFSEINLPYQRKLENGKNKNDKRRKIKFFEKTLMFYYYKGKIPTNLLNNNFSIEHIMPNSSEWEGELDKDRTGNLIPIIAEINTQRGNNSIKSYIKTKEGTEFCEFIKDIIPNEDLYNNIIKHDRKPSIIDNDKYNEMCEKNEKIYQENLIDCLFK